MTELMLNGGVLIIGSLYWQDHKDKIGDDIRKSWRSKNLNINKSVDTSVPIKYGRFSGTKAKGNQTYTMVFDNSLDESQYGNAKIVPLINQIISIEQLIGITKELSGIEGGNQNFIKGDDEVWCICSILFNPKIDQSQKEDILNKWEENLKDNTGRYRTFARQSSLYNVSLKGELLINWPSNAENIDFLIATYTKPKARNGIEKITAEEIASYVENRPYFWPNIKHGITTYQDDEIRSYL